jgi:hypothetical protein
VKRRKRQLRAPLDTSGGREPTGAEFETGVELIRRSGLLKALSSKLDSPTGRPRALSLEGLLVAAQLNALRRHHQAHLVEIARTLNAMSDHQRSQLSISRWDPAEAYDRVHYLFVKLIRVLEEGFEAEINGRRERVNSLFFANSLVWAAVPEDAWCSSSLAVDGTDVETWAALHGDPLTIEPDMEDQRADQPPDGDRRRQGRRRSKPHRAKVFGTGLDGRKIYTRDPDARAGHRTATNSQQAGPYVGYELHLAVQTKDVVWWDGIERVTLGDDVANVVTNLSLAPAGSHRTNSIVPEVLAAKDRGQSISDVVWDPGYSLCQAETGYYPLHRAGIHVTFQPVAHQRGERPFAGDARLVDGQLFSQFVPKDLLDLPMPPLGSTVGRMLAYERAFNRRARYRYSRHAAPEPDGTTRWRCPFCVGFLRSRAFPRTMRRSKAIPLVEVPPGATKCCSGSLSVTAAGLPLWQRLSFGTTAWRISMDRRRAVESVNSALKGGFVHIGRKFFRVFGLAKITVLLAFTVAAFNLQRVRSFLAKQAASVGTKPQRKRRVGTWSDLLDRPSGPAPTGSARPPG